MVNLMLSEPAILKLFERQKAYRTRELLQKGVHPRQLYHLRDEGLLETVERGLFVLSEEAMLSNPDFVIVASKVPKAVICLLSAASYHNLTTHIPNRVDIALPAFTSTPRLGFPPVSVYRFSEPAYSMGIETVMIDGIHVQMYNAEKTVVDIFKFRNKLGVDVAVEVLKRYLERHPRNLERLNRYAVLCRMANVMRPYLEALV